MRFPSLLLTATVAVATAAPAVAHAFTPFTYYTDRAAYLAAVQGQRTTSVATSVATPSGTLSPAGTLDGKVSYTYGSSGAATTCAMLAGAPAGTGIVRGTTTGQALCTSTFNFSSVGAVQALGLTFVANNSGRYALGGLPGMNLTAGQSYFAGIVYDAGTNSSQVGTGLSLAFGTSNDFTVTGFESAAVVTPEPATVALAAAGLAGVAVIARRRRS